MQLLTRNVTHSIDDGLIPLVFSSRHENYSLLQLFTRKTPIPEKSSQLGLIGLSNKDNLYLGTNTIGCEPPPNK